MDESSGLPLMAVEALPVETILDKVKPPLAKEIIEQTATLASSSEGVQSVMAVFGSISLAVTVIGGGVPAGPIISMIRLFKFFFRMRLVNTYFGEILEYFISQLGEMMSTTSYEFSDTDRFYFINTRGKLSRYKVTVFASNMLYDKMLMYLV